MADLIDRAALIYDLIHNRSFYPVCVRRAIETAPTIEAKPVVHGEWEDYRFVKTDCPKGGFPTVKCSECEIVFCDLINNHHFMYHFCPNCGADMRGET